MTLIANHPTFTACVICKRNDIPTEGKHIHFCVVRSGRKVLSREYIGWYDGRPINYSSDRETIETGLNAYVAEQLRQTAIDTADMEAEQAAELSTEAPLWACKACGGKHHIQNCSEIAARLRTPHVPRHIANLAQALAEMQPARTERLLVFEAERLYHLLSAASVLAVGTSHWERLRKLANRAHWRIMRRSVNARCDGAQFPCNKPATRTVWSKTGSDMETARSVTLHYCESCFHELYDEITSSMKYEPKELIAA